jgi:uncharacterized protein YaaR (DUF327 family)
MHTKIQTSEKANGNKGGAAALANYLEKEDLQKENESMRNGELPEPRAGFFNHSNDGLLKNEVINAIDNNKKGLGKEDAKFYSITLSPSETEQKHLLKQLTGREINSTEELSRKELKAYESALKEYSRKAMNEYATHFKRQGLNSGEQLLYFGKVEHNRNYHGTETEVKSGNAKSGEKKPGLHSHIHIIVARKDKEMRWKLSPLASEKGRNNNSKVNGKSVQRGFDRNLFKIKAEKVFDQKFDYKRSLSEKAEVMIEKNKQKNSLNKKSNQELLEAYNKRNNYTKKDKELSQVNQKDLANKRSYFKERGLEI